MKVLSMLQPWASLVVLGAKHFEVRSWQTKHRGPLLIHASAGKPTKRGALFFEQSEYFKDYISSMSELPYGVLIGKVKLAEIYETGWVLQNQEQFASINWREEFAFDDFTPGRFAWHFTHVKKLKYNLPLKGTLGLWEYNGLID